MPQQFSNLHEKQCFYATQNDDPNGVLCTIYENPPYPYFEPNNIGFRTLRNFNHQRFNTREQSDRLIVYEDLEYLLPYNQSFTPEEVHRTKAINPNLLNFVGEAPCIEKDKLITSCITSYDHLWPCEYTFSSWHLAKVNEQNKNTFIEQKNERPYFASILLGNEKGPRKMFYDLLTANNQRDENIISLFNHYRSDFLNQGTGDIDNFFKENVYTQQQDYLNTTLYTNVGFASQMLSKHIEENSWITVVGETIYDDRIFFPTEKIGKALISGKPFIVIGSKHFLKNLRQMGFKTFHPVINETYDLHDDIVTRVRTAYDSFNKLRNQDQQEVRHKLKDILEHNERLMRDKSFITKNARKMLEPLSTQIGL